MVTCTFSWKTSRNNSACNFYTSIRLYFDKSNVIIEISPNVELWMKVDGLDAEFLFINIIGVLIPISNSD